VPSAIRTEARFPPILWVGVGQNEQPVAQVRPADFRRRDDARSNPEAQALKVSDDIVEAEGQMAGDVLEEGPARPDFTEDACNIGPEVAGVVRALAVA
jgi:hypothetical protein